MKPAGFWCCKLYLAGRLIDFSPQLQNVDSADSSKQASVVFGTQRAINNPMTALSEKYLAHFAICRHGRFSNPSKWTATDNAVSSDLRSTAAALQRNSARTTCSGFCSPALIRAQTDSSMSKPPSIHSLHKIHEMSQKFRQYRLCRLKVNAGC